MITKIADKREIKKKSKKTIIHSSILLTKGVSITEMLTLLSQRLIGEDIRSLTSNISATSLSVVSSSFKTTDLLWLIVSLIFLSQGLNSSRIFSLSSSQNGEENFTRTSVLLFRANRFFPFCSSKYFKMGAHPKSLLRIEIFSSRLLQVMEKGLQIRSSC